MRYLKLLLLFMAFPVLAIADNWNDKLYRQIEQNISEPVFPDKEFVITKYGASVKNSALKNQKAINKAIVECSKAGGGKVVVPE